MSMYELQTHSLPAMLCFTAPAPPAPKLMKPMDYFLNSNFPLLSFSSAMKSFSQHQGWRHKLMPFNYQLTIYKNKSFLTSFFQCLLK